VRIARSKPVTWWPVGGGVRVEQARQGAEQAEPQDPQAGDPEPVRHKAGRYKGIVRQARQACESVQVRQANRVTVLA